MVELRSLNLALELDLANIVCFLVDYEMQLGPREVKNPVLDLLVNDLSYKIRMTPFENHVIYTSNRRIPSFS